MNSPTAPLLTIEDFLTNAYFRQWVFNPDEESIGYWTKWMKEHPTQQPNLNYSFSILHSLYMHNKNISDDEVNNEIAKILAKLKDEEAKEATPATAKVFTIKPAVRWAVAAAVILLVASIYFLNQPATPSASYQAFIQKMQDASTEYTNTSDTTKTFTLPDGSSLTLYRNSKATYAFADQKRQVYMEGKAFFDVKKNPAQPFVVYTDKIVTKVLGTSFFVDAYPATKVLSVVVRSGKVSVYNKEDFSETAARPRHLGGLLLTPNQQVVLDKNENLLVKQLVENPVFVKPAASTKFHFEETPVVHVLQALMEEYGIQILYDEEAMSTCTLTAMFDNESFFDKLNIMTKAIGSTYVVIDGNVVINSNGCK
ncbi:FecR family protein [Aridibaculum aurantiacum]|uniref:FecR family protein n=1 Tax=Aridibaculum aurantiacum TaxID=2810307 RepID=UPI001A96DC0D|nr:FecR family protein [Aridibaculum aurantiacum]